jgi:hypothetical protein
MSETTQVKYFHCHRKSCRFVWKTENYLTQGDRFTAICPICERGDEVTETTYRVFNLAQGWDKATGPVTPEGKERVALNGWKNGAHTSVFRLMAPAKPGKYAMCEDCQLAEDCKNKPYKYCPTDLETVAKFVQAYKEQNINDLRELAGLATAKMNKILHEMFHQILSTGVQNEIKIPVLNKDGEVVLDSEGEPIINVRYEKNNLIKDLPAFMTTLGFSAELQDMTPKTRQESETLKGYLKDKEVDQTEVVELKKKHFDELVQMRKAIENMNAAKIIKDIHEQSTTSSGYSSRDGDQQI